MISPNHPHSPKVEAALVALIEEEKRCPNRFCLARLRELRDGRTRLLANFLASLVTLLIVLLVVPILAIFCVVLLPLVIETGWQMIEEWK